jgi:hypothetical protein
LSGTFAIMPSSRRQTSCLGRDRTPLDEWYVTPFVRLLGWERYDKIGGLQAVGRLYAVEPTGTLAKALQPKRGGLAKALDDSRCRHEGFWQGASIDRAKQYQVA